MAELLAPAGSLEHVWTAIDASADAIYLGGKSFNARKFAHNLSDEELARAVQTAHAFGVKIYVTVNIILADKELPALEGYLRYLDDIQVDGIIVQDLAVAAIARRVAPNLPLHGSTQMTVADLGGVRFLESQGFTQAVLSREVSLDEIKRICSQTTMNIEVFIHGASCMSYSGQCLMSSFIGGRSGNRGACAQPCRLPYTLIKDGKAVTKKDMYALSLKDLNSLPCMGDLVEAGVASFKIEGRMKGLGYVQTVVEAYRRVLDSCHRSAQEKAQALGEAKALTEESFNRTYQHDFLMGTVGRKTITEKSSGNQGRRVGRAMSCRRQEVEAILTEPLEPGDMIKIVSPAGQECIDEVRDVIGSFTKKEQFTLVMRRDDLCTGTLYRLARKEDRGLQHHGLTRRIPIYCHVDVTAEGMLRLTAWDEQGHTAEVSDDYVVQRAQKRPATKEWVYGQLNRLGDTIFSLADVTMWAEDYMIPASVLNELRRQAVDAMMTAILQDYERPAAGNVAETKPAEASKANKLAHLGVTVRCDTVEGAEAAARHGADRIIFGGESYTHQSATKEQWQAVRDITAQYDCQLWAATPRIVTERHAEAMRKELQTAIACGADGIYAGAMSVFTLCRDLQLAVPIYADWSLNIFNSQSAAAYARIGCQGITVSTEATLRQIKDMAQQCVVPVEILVQGRIEMMVTEYCTVAALAGKGTKNGCPGVCVGHEYALRDRRDEQFPVVTDPYCRNHILNSKDLDMVPYFREMARAGVQWLRIEARGRSPQWIGQMTTQYRRLCDGTETMLFSKDDRTVTRGHFFRGIV